jgi:CheY-like chemotaxis protein
MKKVMLCEDDDTMVRLLITLLEIEGYQVTQFEGLTEADLVNKLAFEKPDVLLMDVHLRIVNGLDLLKALRRSPIFRDLRIIMTSGMNLSDNCMSNGANAFIMKPFMPEELITTLQKQFYN